MEAARLVSRSISEAAKDIADALKERGSRKISAKPEKASQLQIPFRKRAIPSRPKFFAETVFIKEIVESICLRRKDADRSAVRGFILANCSDSDIIVRGNHKSVKREKAFEIFDAYMNTFKS